MYFDPQIELDAHEHARQQYPKEAVGFVVAGRYVPQDNVADNAQEHFTVPAQAFVNQTTPVQAIIHSHPEGPNYPNKVDMQGQLDTAVPWGIVPIVKQAVSGELVCGKIVWWGDQLEIPPLVGRGFVHGITDCYSIIRDFYRVRFGIVLKEHPRDWEWWLHGEKMYEMGFEETGFVRVSIRDPKPGDLFFACIRCKTPNHGGVWLGGPTGEILHHLTSRNPVDPTWLSRREPGIRYLKFVENGGIWCRHKELM